MTGQDNRRVRLQTVSLTCRLLAPLLDSGLVLSSEYNTIKRNLHALAKTGELALPIESKLLTPQEVAGMLAISYSQFRALEKENVFPFKRMMIGNKTVRYRNSDVIRYIEAGNSPEIGGEAKD